MQCKAVSQRILITQQISNTVVVGTVITEPGNGSSMAQGSHVNLDREKSIREYSGVIDAKKYLNRTMVGCLFEIHN